MGEAGTRGTWNSALADALLRVARNERDAGRQKVFFRYFLKLCVLRVSGALVKTGRRLGDARPPGRGAVGEGGQTAPRPRDPATRRRPRPTPWAPLRAGLCRHFLAATVRSQEPGFLLSFLGGENRRGHSPSGASSCLSRRGRRLPGNRASHVRASPAQGPATCDPDAGTRLREPRFFRAAALGSRPPLCAATAMCTRGHHCARPRPPRLRPWPPPRALTATAMCARGHHCARPRPPQLRPRPPPRAPTATATHAHVPTATAVALAATASGAQRGTAHTRLRAGPLGACRPAVTLGTVVGRAGQRPLEGRKVVCSGPVTTPAPPRTPRPRLVPTPPATPRPRPPPTAASRCRDSPQAPGPAPPLPAPPRPPRSPHPTSPAETGTPQSENDDRSACLTASLRCSRNLSLSVLNLLVLFVSPRLKLGLRGAGPHHWLLPVFRASASHSAGTVHSLSDYENSTRASAGE